MVSLSYPMRARLGDSVPVQMVVQSKKLDSAPFEIQAVAQIELPGMVFSPDGAEMEGFSGGKAQQYDWKGTAQREGSFSGRVWLSFRMIDAANHAGPETVVSAQPITILAYALFGKNQAWVTNCAWICAVCGLICTFVAARLGKRSSPFGG
jgi:hypothetical protein